MDISSFHFLYDPISPSARLRKELKAFKIHHDYKLLLMRIKSKLNELKENIVIID